MLRKLLRQASPTTLRATSHGVSAGDSLRAVIQNMKLFFRRLASRLRRRKK
jgi:hypothetical protein